MKNNAKVFEYSVNQVPRGPHLFLLSFQHVLLMVSSLALPILFGAQIGGSADFVNSLVSFSMLAAGFGSIIQGIRLPFVGSGYLCPNLCGPSYFSLTVSAAWTGGIPLMRGMIIVAGLVEMAMAPFIQQLKVIFPRFIAGLVVAMVGISIVKPGVTSLFGLSYKGDAIQVVDIAVGSFTLLVMVLANLWGKGFLKMYCLIIGMAAGWIAALIFIPEFGQTLDPLHRYPIFALPSLVPEFGRITFDLKMLIPFVVIAVSGSLKSFGNLLAAQKLSQPELKEPDFIPIRNGLMADGLSTAAAGLLGGMAVDTSSSNIGLAGATKVLSRWICVGAGVLFCLMAFFPKIVLLLSLTPKPVLGASIIFSGGFMVCTGLQEMFSEAWSPHKTFVAGISLIFGLSTAFLPELYARAPVFIQTFFTDPLPTTATLAIVLNVVFHLNTIMTRVTKKA